MIKKYIFSNAFGAGRIKKETREIFERYIWKNSWITCFCACLFFLVRETVSVATDPLFKKKFY